MRFVSDYLILRSIRAVNSPSHEEMMNNPIHTHNRLSPREPSPQNLRISTPHQPQEADTLKNSDQSYNVFKNPLTHLFKFITMLTRPSNNITNSTSTPSTLREDSLEAIERNYEQPQDLDNLIVTNDYHLVLNADNSILIDDQNSEVIEEPAPHNVFLPFLEPRLQKGLQSLVPLPRYGTNFENSISYLKDSTYQQNYHPESTIVPSNDWKYDNDDQYKVSVEKFYAKPPSEDFSELDTLVSNYHIEDEVFSKYTRERNDLLDKLDKERALLSSKITTLTPDQLQKVNNIWKTRGNAVVVSKFQIDITVGDLKTLQDGKWLNDNIIDFYLNMITASEPKVYVWTTHFFTTLQSKGYQGVARWAKRKKLNLFDLDIVLVPINVLNTHWALACINNVDATIQYIDSLTTTGNYSAVKLLATYMSEEAKRLNVKAPEYELHGNVKSPQQNNGSDCGVFTCTNARFRAQRRPSNFSQKDMKTIRRRMAFEILTTQILD